MTPLPFGGARGIAAAAPRSGGVAITVVNDTMSVVRTAGGVAPATVGSGAVALGGGAGAGYGAGIVYASMSSDKNPRSGASCARSGKSNPPNASDPALQDAYKNLWRPQDKKPGGTIGELLREVECGRPLKHLMKAKERLKQLVDRVTDTTRPLTPADRAGAERVINDLKEAIKTAEGR